MAKGEWSKEHGKDYVRGQRPGATVEFTGSGYEVMHDGESLGWGKDPMDAWHDAAVELRAELAPGRDAR